MPALLRVVFIHLANTELDVGVCRNKASDLLLILKKQYFFRKIFNLTVNFRKKWINISPVVSERKSSIKSGP